MGAKVYVLRSPIFFHFDKCYSFAGMTLPAKQVIEYRKIVTKFVFIQYCSHFCFFALLSFIQVMLYA